MGESWHEQGKKIHCLFFLFLNQIIRIPGPMMLLFKRTDFKDFEKENRKFHLRCSGSSIRGAPTATRLGGESPGLSCKGTEWMRLPDKPRVGELRKVWAPATFLLSKSSTSEKSKHSLGQPLQVYSMLHFPWSGDGKQRRVCCRATDCSPKTSC